VLLPVGLGRGPDALGDAVDVVEVGDHLDRVVDRRVVEPDRAQPVGLPGTDRRGIEGEVSRVVTERTGASIEVGCESVIVLRLMRKLFWGALCTEVVCV
jgi:hypothetical protein